MKRAVHKRLEICSSIHAGLEIIVHCRMFNGQRKKPDITLFVSGRLVSKKNTAIRKKIKLLNAS
jgi:hypothetical protein